MIITVLGLGPGNPEHLTRQAWNLLAQANEIYLRTSRHPTIAALPEHLTLHSFDALYESLDDFESVYETIAEQVVDLGRRPEGVLYAVPGHPLVGESSVQRILERASEAGLAVRLVEGLSFVEPVLSLLGIDGLDNLQLADATDLAIAHHPPLDPDRPALIGQLYGQRLAGEVKLTLMNAYPDDHLITLVRAAGTEGSATVTLPLFELDRGQSVDHLTTCYVPPLAQAGSLSALQETVAHLRAPDGCPWDQEQTHQALRTNLLEETYEVLATIDADDPHKLSEELGDLLMQIAMHAQIATEEGVFQFADVIGQIDAKLKRRHPHVFGDLKVEGTGDVLKNWESIKAEERVQEGNAHRSPLDGVPTILPSLARAQALGDRAARVGFDWPDIDGVLDKVSEEIAEIRGTEDSEAQEWEFGDLLFALVNVARWLEIDAESALRQTCDRFTRRYAAMERMAQAENVDLSTLSLTEQDAFWDRAKACE